LKRAYAKRHDSHKPERTQPAVPIGATDREIQLSLDRDELLGLMQDSLESLALKLGMLVASSLLEDEVTRLCGRRYERQPQRTHTRYGHQRVRRPWPARRSPSRGPVCDAPTGAARSRWRHTPDCNPPRPCPRPCSAAWSAA
jgi:hypothetical protein